MSLIEQIMKSHGAMTETEFLGNELASFITSSARQKMIKAREYYKGIQDIRHKKRVMVDKNGIERPLKNLPNNIIVDNRYDDLVDQKANYLLSKPLEVVTDNEDIKNLFNKRFMKALKDIGKDSLIGGCGYLLPYINDNKLKFKRIKPEQVLVFWGDEEKTEVDAFMYFYEIETYIKREKQLVTHVEYYTSKGVQFYTWDGKQLKEEKEPSNHISSNIGEFNFKKAPLIPFKANSEMLLLLDKVKTLQDALNTLQSNYVDNMEEDVRQSIFVLHNYDGQDLAEFRRNLASVGAIKVRSTGDGASGGVETIQVHVNAENYLVIIKLLKDAIVENGRGFNAKDDRMSNNPNQMNIRSMYSDIELDADEMQSEFTCSLELLMEFVKAYYSLNNKTVDDTEFIFNRDLPINEAGVIDNCRNSVGLLSQETIINNHPWVKSTEDELKRVDEEKQKAIDEYMDSEVMQR